MAVAANVGSEALSSDPASSEMEEAALTVQGHAATHTEHEGPEQLLANFELPVVDTSGQDGESAGAPKCPTQSTTSCRGIDAVAASTQQDRARLQAFRRGKKRGVSNVKEEQPRQEEPDYRATATTLSS